WMASIVDILATNHKVILLLKENLRSEIIISNIINKDNVTIIQPSDYSNNIEINEQQALEVIRKIDFVHPRLRGVLVRGIIAANELVSDRIFKYRTISYLTDFYEVNNGQIHISNIKEQLVKNIALHSHLMLIQTKEIKEKLFSLLGYSHSNFTYLPPSLPDAMFKQSEKIISVSKAGEIKIGYAGKIMPDWGCEELLSWVIEFNKNNKTKVKLFIAANKISAPGEQRKPFVSKILKLLKEANAEHYTTFNREQCIDLLKKMDYVWAYRPAKFENATLEVSTKLLEAVAIGQKVICYPSKIHINELGENYPFYVKDKESFYQIISSNKLFDLTSLVNKLKVKHSISNVAERLSYYPPLNTEKDTNNSKIICFAGHDFKFIDPYISYLKSNGFNVIRDVWEWGTATDLASSKENYSKADIIFCEWGLANAVYFSKNNPDSKPLYIRVHLQEINERARKFGKQINFDNITKIIFVSENVRGEYIKLFGISKEKTIVIPNFVLDDEYNGIKNKKSEKRPITLGMVGIVPQRKRFDRAVDLLIELNNRGIDTELRIKGHRPENLEFMKGASRIQELDYYYEVYNKIKEKGLESKVIFSHWGNDVALWYKDIDFILSPSDFESFHYALADGVLSGSIPVIWNWSEATSIYQDSWIVSSQEQAVSYITKYVGKDNKKVIASNRDFIIKKYGKNSIFNALNKEILGN
ncbi:glycosyltransferase family 4 protein, partial [Rodentibacter rarus]